MSLIKILIRYLENPTWKSTETCDFVTCDNTVDVWRINISSNLSLLNKFLATMNPEEIARANRYFHLKDKNRSIIGRGALRYILGKYLNRLPDLIEFGIGENKKPHILNTGQTDLHYNVSHSGDWILIAISNSEIGADTEFINHNFRYDEVTEDNFTADEINYIKQTKSVDRFFTLWTRKEALTKATAKGLDEDLKLIPCLDGVNFAESTIISSQSDLLISTFKLYNHYIASVVSHISTEKINFWDINLS
jgi:4'-phosphopantetheinyl transferase